MDILDDKPAQVFTHHVLSNQKIQSFRYKTIHSSSVIRGKKFPQFDVVTVLLCAAAETVLVETGQGSSSAQALLDLALLELSLIPARTPTAN